MNFTSAIQAHTNWKLRLAAYCSEMAKMKETIDIGALAKDDACELGKWLHGGGRQYAADSEYSSLLDEHAAFHRSAAEIARTAAGGKRKEAGALVNSRESEFCKHSLQVVAILMRFRTRHGDG